ncbi:hypothetical protein SEUCBS139899_003456 [Sporothrix eucalyptigena]
MDAAIIRDNRGRYDYGPPGCALQVNIVEEWRSHFVIEENIMELVCTAIMPAEDLKTSCHVDRFADFKCRDPVRGEHLRADHLVKGVLETRLENHGKAVAGQSKYTKLDEATAAEFESILAKLDSYGGPELGELVEQYGIRNPNGDCKVLPPVPFNLMFQSTIGPSAAAPIFLQPETAPLVDNETLGHFLVRIYLFLLKTGADPARVRFRQHLNNEMAHYACDYWAAELSTKVTLDKKVLGPRFKKDATAIEAAVATLAQTTLARPADELVQNAVITLPDIVEHTRKYTPNVIEQSFGNGRILYSVLEHVHWHRPDDVTGGVLSLPMLVAPTKVLIAPLSSNQVIQPSAKKLAARLRRLHIANDADSSSTSIDKRYACAQ